ncbi:MAG: hypoxanthine phosphoribosyltransferase [Deltaproteobacteria bacterium]|nr:hypoxanthine phosphoribosyltransferase [Deltaproteobacteria bacterium]
MNAPIPVFIDEKKIACRVQELAKAIEKDYQKKEIVAIAPLGGSFIFFADLVRNINLPVYCEFLSLSPYSRSSGEVKILLDVKDSLEGKHLLLIEDLVDSGLTLNYLQKALMARNPLSLKTCALVVKKVGLPNKVAVDYAGFEVSEHFLVGYGIDDKGRYRQLPYLGILSSHNEHRTE